MSVQRSCSLSNNNPSFGNSVFYPFIARRAFELPSLFVCCADAAVSAVYRLLHRGLPFSWRMAGSGAAGSRSDGVFSSLRNVRPPRIGCAVSHSASAALFLFLRGLEFGVWCACMLFVQGVSVPLGGSRHEREDRSSQGEQLCFSMGPVAEGAVQPGSEAGAAVAQHRCPWPSDVRALRGWPGPRGSLSVKTKKELGARPGLPSPKGLPI